LAQKIDITWAELLGISIPFQRSVLSLKNHYPVPEKTNLDANSLSLVKARIQQLVSPTPKLPIRIENSENKVLKKNALLDTGAEINCMSKALIDLLQIPYTTETSVSIKPAYGDMVGFTGVASDVSIRIGSIEVLTDFFILAGAHHDVLLGQPFVRSYSLSFEYPDGSGGPQIAHLREPYGTKGIKVQVADKWRDRDSEWRLKVQTLAIQLTRPNDSEN
jgi:hypothetical protein